LIAAVVVAFGAALGGPFVFDDFGLLNDPAIASRSGWWQCWLPLQTRPLTWFSFWASYQIGGENALGYRLVSLVLHGTVVGLLWDVLRRLIPERAALIATALFAVHPLVVEPVAYIYDRGTLLAALFSLLAIRSWIRKRTAWAIGWFIVAMLAKEECAALPLFLALFDWSRGLRPRLRPLGAMSAIALAFGLRVIWAASIVEGSQAGTQAGISPVTYFGAQGPVILKYLRMLILPWGFSIDYTSTPSPILESLGAWGVITAAMALAMRHFKNLGPGFWFIAGLVLLLPSSSIFPAADLQNDRRMYLPLIAFSGCLSILLQQIDWRILVAGMAGIIAIDLHYAAQWRNPEALWTEAVLQAPEKVRPRLQLARIFDADRGLRLLDEAQRLAPDDPQVAIEQGRILLSANQPGNALAAFGRALALDPGDARALNDRGAALAALGQTTAASSDFKRSLARDPCLFDARLNLARSGEKTPEPDGCRYTDRQREMLGK
jgi:hypothetical protein